MEHIKLLIGDASAIIQDSASKACGGAATACGKADLNQIFVSITSALMFLIGAIAVVMLIIGGLRFVTSNGDPSNVKSARETILYSIIGLIIAMTAFAIVNFVAKRF
jgi:hypothetical protein